MTRLRNGRGGPHPGITQINNKIAWNFAAFNALARRFQGKKKTSKDSWQTLTPG
jgi:hypothetical protein